jgi:hypothetical protein
VGVAVGGLLLTPGTVAAGTDSSAPSVVCRFSDARLVEISGITWSRRHPGAYWVHNDSGGGPYIYAIDGRSCRTLARIRIAGIGARDIEAIATGTDPRGRHVLWVGDIGDNNDVWPSVRLHAVVEPERLVDQQVLATTYRFTYADRPHNAESILAAPDRPEVWVVTKQLAAGAVWRIPLSNAAPSTGVKLLDVGGLITDAAMSPDGRHYVIRDYIGAQLYDAPVSATSLQHGRPVSLPLEPQGEAISYTADGSALLVASERDTALWRVPIPTGQSASAPATPTSSGVPSSSASSIRPSASTSSSAAGRPLVGGGSAIVRAAVVIGAGLAALVVVVVASRRFRR